MRIFLNIVAAGKRKFYGTSLCPVFYYSALSSSNVKDRTSHVAATVFPVFKERALRGGDFGGLLKSLLV